jgi:hypothetical protein
MGSWRGLPLAVRRVSASPEEFSMSASPMDERRRTLSLGSAVHTTELDRRAKRTWAKAAALASSAPSSSSSSFGASCGPGAVPVETGGGSSSSASLSVGEYWGSWEGPVPVCGVVLNAMELTRDDSRRRDDCDGEGMAKATTDRCESLPPPPHLEEEANGDGPLPARPRGGGGSAGREVIGSSSVTGLPGSLTTDASRPSDVGGANELRRNA